MTNLEKALKECGILKVDLLDLLEAYEKKTGIKISHSKQTLYNWLKKGTVPTSATRIAVVKVLNAVRTSKGLKGECNETSIFPVLPAKHYHKIDAEKIVELV